MPVLSFSEIICVQFLVLQHQMYWEIWSKKRDCLLYSENMLRTPLSNWQYACIQITVAIFKVSSQNQKLFPSSFDNQKSAFISKDLILSYETTNYKLRSRRETFSSFNKPKRSTTYVIWFSSASHWILSFLRQRKTLPILHASHTRTSRLCLQTTDQLLYEVTTMPIWRPFRNTLCWKFLNLKQWT